MKNMAKKENKVRIHELAMQHLSVLSLEVKHGIHKNEGTTNVFPSNRSLPQQVDFQDLQYPLIL